MVLSIRNLPVEFRSSQLIISCKVAFVMILIGLKMGCLRRPIVQLLHAHRPQAQLGAARQTGTIAGWNCHQLLEWSCSWFCFLFVMMNWQYKTIMDTDPWPYAIEGTIYIIFGSELSSDFPFFKPIFLKCEGVRPVTFLNWEDKWWTLLKPVRYDISVNESRSYTNNLFTFSIRCKIKYCSMVFPSMEEKRSLR